MAKLFAIKPMSYPPPRGQHRGRSIPSSVPSEPLNLITLGIGAIIGAGIFVLTGQAAAKHAGPAVMLSFIFAGITCAFAGLCYAEFASLIPIAGSAYTYGYATLGELVAWIIGWDLVLEYAFGAATVASGWSGYFVGLLADSCTSPSRRSSPPSPGNVLSTRSRDHWVQLASLPAGSQSRHSLPHVTGVFNLVAFLAILADHRRSRPRHRGVRQPQHRHRLSSSSRSSESSSSSASAGSSTTRLSAHANWTSLHPAR